MKRASDPKEQLAKKMLGFAAHAIPVFCFFRMYDDHSYVNIYIYIYIYVVERERERKREIHIYLVDLANAGAVVLT